MSGFGFPGGFEPFRELHREVGRLFETLQTSPAARALRPYPPLNFYEREEAYIVTAEVPGMDPAALDVSLTGETLTLRGERRRPEEVPEASYRRRERPFGRWSRTVTVPGRLDPEAVSAHYARGILTVTLPKSEGSRPRQIVVSSS